MAAITKEADAARPAQARPAGRRATMRTARLHEYKKPLVLEEVPRPVPQAGQVLVRIAGSGFCHSDLHIMGGELPLELPLPLTLGHENAGFVAEVGAGVNTVREGDPVVVFGGWGCGLCDYCVSGATQLCSAPEWVGLSKWQGGYAQYLLVPRPEYLIPLKTLDPKRAAPLADAALTPYRAVRKAMPYLQPDHLALVLGVGGLGQYGMKFLKAFSGSPIIAVDVSEEKLKTARHYGASNVFNGRDPELVKKILELTRGQGVCAAFDFVGSDATLSAAIACTRSLGKVTQVGLAGGAARLKVLENSRFEVLFEATLWGTIKELREVVALAEDGRISLNEAEFAPLDQINAVHDRLTRGEVRGRVVITP